MDDNIKILIQLYEDLREEILQSISLQNKVILSEAILVGLVYGLKLSGEMSESESKFQTIIAAVPPIIVVSTSIWLVEQSRMMRAGDYLEFVEDEINHEMGELTLSWENWLRRQEGAPYRLLTPERIHHLTQYVGYLGFFFFIGIVSLWLYVLEILGTTPAKLLANPGQLASPLGGYFVANLSALALLILFGLPIVLHRHKRADKEQYQEWKQRYDRAIDEIYKSGEGETDTDNDTDSGND